MWTAFWIIFWLVFAGLVVFFVLTLRDIWRSLKNLAAAGSRFTEAFANVTVQSSVGTDVVPYQSAEERRAEARTTRNRIADQRRAARHRRLDHAEDRWADGTAEYEDRFTDEYRDQARAHRQESHNDN